MYRAAANVNDFEEEKYRTFDLPEAEAADKLPAGLRALELLRLHTKEMEMEM